MNLVVNLTISGKFDNYFTILQSFYYNHFALQIERSDLPTAGVGAYLKPGADPGNFKRRSELFHNFPQRHRDFYIKDLKNYQN